MYSNSTIPLDEQQKEYLNKRIKFENRKKEYEKNKPSFLTSSFKSIFGLFSSTTTTASAFVERLQF